MACEKREPRFEISFDFDWDVSFYGDDLGNIISPHLRCSDGVLCSDDLSLAKERYGSISPQHLFDCLCCIGMSTSLLIKALHSLTTHSIERVSTKHEPDCLIDYQTVLNDVSKYRNQTISDEALKRHGKRLRNLLKTEYKNNNPGSYDYIDMEEKDIDWFLAESLCTLILFATTIRSANLHEDSSPIDHAWSTMYSCSWLLSIYEKGLIEAGKNYEEEGGGDLSYMESVFEDVLRNVFPWPAVAFRLYDVRREVVLERMPDLPQTPKVPSHRDVFTECLNVMLGNPR